MSGKWYNPMGLKNVKLVKARNYNRSTSRRLRRRRNKRVTWNTFYRGPQPRDQIVHMRYCCYKALNPVAGGACAYVNFRANGIYDPDCAVGGQQPLGHDEWSAFFNHYVVLGSRCIVTFQGLNDTEASFLPNVVGIMLNDDEIVDASSWVNLAEQANCKYILTQGSPSSSAPHTVTLGYSARKRYRTNNPKNMDAITATMSADPSDQTIFTVFCGAMDQLTDTAGVKCIITIDYSVLLFEPIELSRS